MISPYLCAARRGKVTAKLFATSRGRNILCLGAEDMRVQVKKQFRERDNSVSAMRVCACVCMRMNVCVCMSVCEHVCVSVCA